MALGKLPLRAWRSAWTAAPVGVFSMIVRIREGIVCSGHQSPEQNASTNNPMPPMAPAALDVGATDAMQSPSGNSAAAASIRVTSRPGTEPGSRNPKPRAPMSMMRTMAAVPIAAEMVSWAASRSAGPTGVTERRRRKPSSRYVASRCGRTLMASEMSEKTMSTGPYTSNGLSPPNASTGSLNVGMLPNAIIRTTGSPQPDHQPCGLAQVEEGLCTDQLSERRPVQGRRERRRIGHHASPGVVGSPVNDRNACSSDADSTRT